MPKIALAVLLATAFAAPAMAQSDIVPPAGPNASSGTNAAIAHHDRMIALRASRHHHPHKAAAANAAANAASAQANAPH